MTLPTIDFPWSTPFIADGCVALGVPIRLGRNGLRPMFADARVYGRVCPAQHAGSVDVFLEAIADAQPGDVLVIDNNGRLDEGCIGDLVAGEAQCAGLAGLIVDGAHRDTMAIRALGVAVWSMGVCPAGPQRLHARPPHALEAATIGSSTVTRQDVVFADDDGVVFVAAAELPRVLAAAQDIAVREQSHAERLGAGERLSTQFRLAEYLETRRENAAFTFRDHLKRLGGAIEI